MSHSLEQECTTWFQLWKWKAIASVWCFSTLVYRHIKHKGRKGGGICCYNVSPNGNLNSPQVLCVRIFLCCCWGSMIKIKHTQKKSFSKNIHFFLCSRFAQDSLSERDCFAIERGLCYRPELCSFFFFFFLLVLVWAREKKCYSNTIRLNFFSRAKKKASQCLSVLTVHSFSHFLPILLILDVKQKKSWKSKIQASLDMLVQQA